MLRLEHKLNGHFQTCGFVYKQILILRHESSQMLAFPLKVFSTNSHICTANIIQIKLYDFFYTHRAREQKVVIGESRFLTKYK